MELEQTKPNKPNFKLIGLLVIVVLPIIFLLGWILVRTEGSRLMPHHTNPHPTSSLTLPRTDQSRSAATVLS